MADKPAKPSIPAWQLGKQPDRPDEQAPSQESQAQQETIGAPSGNEDPTASTPDLAASTSSPPFQETSSSDDDSQQRDRVRAFLTDPSVKDQSVDKKRAFLQSKEIPAHLIDQELRGQSFPAMNPADFQSFQQRDQPQPQPPNPPARAQQPPTPPIITYPEFLADAHRPPPIITPERILYTTYFASATAALLYGASTFLVKPMTAALTDARHDFASHSLSKVYELNARLEKVVSRIPDRSHVLTDDDTDDSESVASDPTELFHRDMGTQTDSSVGTRATPPRTVRLEEPAMPAEHAEKLRSVRAQLTEILDAAQSTDSVMKERQESVSRLRHYLDSMSYGSVGANVWSAGGSGFGWGADEDHHDPNKEKKEDVIDALKKEIRGVKGVLLSAKRFPAAARGPPRREVDQMA